MFKKSQKEINQSLIPIFDFLENRIDIDRFQNNIYNNQELIQFFGIDHHNDLISFDFNSLEFKSFAKTLFVKFNILEEYYLFRNKKLLEDIITERVGLVEGSNILLSYYNEERDTLSGTILSLKFVYNFEDELDKFPLESRYHQWNKEALSNILKELNLIKKEKLKLVSDEFERLK